MHFTEEEQEALTLRSFCVKKGGRLPSRLIRCLSVLRQIGRY